MNDLQGTITGQIYDLLRGAEASGFVVEVESQSGVPQPEVRLISKQNGTGVRVLVQAYP